MSSRFNTSLEKLEVKGDTLNGGHYAPWRHVVVESSGNGDFMINIMGMQPMMNWRVVSKMFYVQSYVRAGSPLTVYIYIS